MQTASDVPRGWARDWHCGPPRGVNVDKVLLQIDLPVARDRDRRKIARCHKR